MTMRSSLVMLAAAVALGVAAPATAADGVRIKLGEWGLESLTYDGVEYVDPSGAGGLGFTGGGSAIRGAGGAAFDTKPTATKADGNTVEQTYPWGTLTAVYEAKAELEKAKLGPVPKEQVYDTGGKETLPKAKYAHDRWGCTLFYVDNISGVFGHWSMDEAARGLPDCLFLPEWALARSYRCSAQLSVTFTPAKGWKGADLFTFKASDATGPSSNRGTVTITVK